MAKPPPPPEPNWDRLRCLSVEELALNRLDDGEVVKGMLYNNKEFIRFSSNSQYISFNISTEGWSKDFLFEITREERGRSIKYFVICPVTSEKLAKLYVHDGAIVSRPGYRRLWYRRELADRHARDRAVGALLHRAGAVKAPRAGLIADLRRVGGGDSPEAQKLLSHYEAKEKALEARADRRTARQAREALVAKNARAKMKADPWGTAAGLRAGRKKRRPPAPKASKHPLFRAKAQLWYEELGDFPSVPTDASRGAVEDHLKLDLRVMAAQRCLVAGQLTIVDLVWGNLAADIDRVRLAIDLREEAMQEIRIAFDRGADSFIQNVGLNLVKVGERLRPTFVCTRSGLVVETLSYRFGCFAERKYQRLTFRSQLRAKKKA